MKIRGSGWDLTDVLWCIYHSYNAKYQIVGCINQPQWGYSAERKLLGYHSMIYIYVCMHECMHLSIYLSIYLSMYLSIYLSIYVSIYVSMNLCM